MVHERGDALAMQKVEASDDSAAAGALAEHRHRTITITASLRLAAGVTFLVLGILWTTSRQASMGVVALPLFLYVAIASAFFTCGASAIVQRTFWMPPWLDIGFAFVVFHGALPLDAAFAPSWAVVSLAVYTLIVALSGISLPLRMVGLVTAMAVAAESEVLNQAGLHLGPMLVAALALAFVATATSTVQRKVLQALRQSRTVAESLAELRSQQRALEQLQREKDSLLEVVVHDMRSPVGAAVLSLEYVALELRKYPNQSALLEAADDGLATLNSLGGMMAQILDTSKLEAGRLTLRLDIVPVRPIVEAAVREALERARSRGVTLDFEAHEDIQAAVDARLLPRAFEVLLAYGLRRTPGGGRMLLAATTTAKETRISLHATAPAISPSERERIFDKFPLAEPEARRKSAWGLGLYFCRLVVSAHQGTLAVEDVDGWPTSFVIRLPSVSTSA